ncbi:MAG: flagellar export chaperone FliS [Nitrospinae bacterium RIFCSPLOWO2_12_FULL_45_22]|nr:MAG: flagellar export chaperone FliS [Nitrospinae bacterium RIFCSPLOWO2_12_FULL_45_22]
MQQNVSSFYQENQIRTADQGRLIVMLYERAIFSLKQAQEKIVAGDYYQRNQLILKAQNIILELMNTLNFEAGKIAYSLQSLYNYMIRRLILADQTSDQQIIQEVIKILSELKEAWETIALQPNNISSSRTMDRMRVGVAVR